MEHDRRRSVKKRESQITWKGTALLAIKVFRSLLGRRDDGTTMATELGFAVGLRHGMTWNDMEHMNL
jgi:hypothetical protein